MTAAGQDARAETVDLAAVRQSVVDLLDALSGGDCLFWACEGPRVEPVSMLTCRACWAAHDLAVQLGVPLEQAP